MLLLLPLAPVPLVLHAVMPEAHTFLFVISILSILPLTVLLALATEQLAARTGDTIGGLLNATLGNLSELIIALSALKAGEYLLVKASLAGAIVTNTLFLVGMSFFLGGLRHQRPAVQQCAYPRAVDAAVPRCFRSAVALRHCGNGPPGAAAIAERRHIAHSPRCLWPEPGVHTGHPQEVLFFRSGSP